MIIITKVDKSDWRQSAAARPPEKSKIRVHTDDALRLQRYKLTKKWTMGPPRAVRLMSKRRVWWSKFDGNVEQPPILCKWFYIPSHSISRIDKDKKKGEPDPTMEPPKTPGRFDFSSRLIKECRPYVINITPPWSFGGNEMEIPTWRDTFDLYPLNGRINNKARFMFDVIYTIRTRFCWGQTRSVPQWRV